MNDAEIRVSVTPSTEEFDAWVASLRVLVSQIGFALDNYLASRPASDITEEPQQ